MRIETREDATDDYRRKPIEIPMVNALKKNTCTVPCCGAAVADKRRECARRVCASLSLSFSLMSHSFSPVLSASVAVSVSAFDDSCIDTQSTSCMCSQI